MFTHYLEYSPAEYVEGKRSYIQFHFTHPFTKKVIRKRLYLQLNRIKNLAQRRTVGLQYVSKFNEQLAADVIPHANVDFLPIQILETTLLSDYLTVIIIFPLLIFLGLFWNRKGGLNFFFWMKRLKVI